MFGVSFFLQQRVVDDDSGRVFGAGVNFCLRWRGHDFVFICGHDD